MNLHRACLFDHRLCDILAVFRLPQPLHHLRDGEGVTGDVDVFQLCRLDVIEGFERLTPCRVSAVRVLRRGDQRLPGVLVDQRMHVVRVVAVGCGLRVVGVVVEGGPSGPVEQPDPLTFRAPPCRPDIFQILAGLTVREELHRRAVLRGDSPALPPLEHE